MLDKKFFNELGKETSLKYRQLVFDPKGGGENAKDVYGDKYDEYNNPEDENSYGVRKRSGNLYRQASKFKDSNAPVLTGDLALSIKGFKKFKSHSTGFGFGSVTQKGKIKSLAKKGRVIYTKQKPLPDKCSKFLMKELDKDVNDEFKKIRKAIRRKKININIGK